MEKIFYCQLKGITTKVSISKNINDVLAEISGISGKKLFIADENTKHFLGENNDIILLPPGEKAKTLESVEYIITQAKMRGFSRDDTFVAVGGGVICDITGFASSLYMRGAGLILIPTTLLAQVDASVGGKTGVDFDNSKNFIGTFYPAMNVYISVDTLNWLPDNEFKNGLGEVLKHALLDKTLDVYNLLTSQKKLILNRDEKALIEMISASLKVKIHYIEQDPKEEKGIRDALNLGHTFAHALESVGNLTQFSHGEAVAWGVIKSLTLSRLLALCDENFASTYISLFNEYGFDITCQVIDIPLFLSSLDHDKKKREGKVRFIVMKGQGKPLLLPLEKEVIIPFL